MIVEIVHVESKGLTVQLRDGRKGFVPRSELSWSRENPSPLRLFKEGDRINVVILSQSRDFDRQIYSIRKRSPDPWDTSKLRYSNGQDILAKVTSIFEDAIFVEFEEGISARVAIHEIGPSDFSCSSESISLGDILRVRITGRNEEHRNFMCSNTQAIEEQNYSNARLETVLESNSAIVQKDTSRAGVFNTGPISVLLIDDDESFCVSTKRAFDLAGHSFEYTTDPETGITLATQGAYDIVVIDLVMPKLHGVEVLRKIREINRDVLMAIFTGEDTISIAGFKDLAPKPLVLHKPFDISDIEAACFNEVRSPSQLVPEATKPSVETIVSLKSNAINKNSDDYVVDQIGTLLERIDHTLSGVFKWIEYDQRLLFLDGLGFKTGSNVEQMERQLFYSPLKNIAEDREVVFTPSVSDSSDSFKRSLKNIFPFTEYFESFYSAPVVVQDHSRYVVLYGHVMPNMFNKDTQKYILDRHVVIAAELAVRETYKQAEAMQKLALRGELTASLAHEIRNRLHILSMNMKVLKKLGPRAEHKLRQAKSLVPKELGELNAILDESQTALDKISEVVTSFSEDIAEKGYSEFDLTNLVRSVVSRLKLIASRKRVPIYIPSTDQCIAKGSPSRLGQVIENVILNAIQHTAGFRNKDGSVFVQCGKDSTLNAYFVEVSDNGEGIHTKDFDRIFEMGFTTKETGSGVGLALCSAAMRSLKGKVFVKQSILFEGTTMRIEWPTMEKGNADQ